MKNLWKLLGVLIVLGIVASSCSMQEFIDPWDFELDFSYKQDTELHEFLTNYNIKKQDKFNKIHVYTSHGTKSAIKYEGDHKNYLPIPQNIINSRRSECQGKSLLAIALIKKYLDIKCNYVEVFLIKAQASHAVFQYKNELYNSTSYRKMKSNEYTITKTINFDDLAWHINLSNSI